ncbi:MAG TPA: aminoacyl-tRNA hydrolase [Patescibacteria group bacterium]|jgi:PTH1 family peptidyl-tRNA hydrolase|nr:aminoacyl-tRNA hydrolase [Patescibacteria group bacterium]
MKLIVGLGNPGNQYEQTRHNAGFLAIDFFLKSHEAITCQSKFNAQICEYQKSGADGEVVKVFLVKPQSFMNLSGEVVREILSFYKLDHANDLLVLHDEVDFPIGTIKEAFAASSAGHNGVQNIMDELGTKDFARIRIGVESRENRADLPTDAFVLQKFQPEELEKLEKEVFPKTSELIETFIKS